MNIRWKFAPTTFLRITLFCRQNKFISDYVYIAIHLNVAVAGMDLHSRDSRTSTCLIKTENTYIIFFMWVIRLFSCPIDDFGPAALTEFFMPFHAQITLE